MLVFLMDSWSDSQRAYVSENYFWSLPGHLSFTLSDISSLLMIRQRALPELKRCGLSLTRIPLPERCGDVVQF